VLTVALIFGVSGQDGHYLSQLLRAEGVEVVGISRSHGDHLGSVADAAFVNAMLQRYQPAFVFHLAATSSTRHEALYENHDSISTGTLNILEGARLHCPAARVFLSGSGLQFRNDGSPISETTPFEASSPYAAARIHSTYLGRYYRARFGLRVYLGYFFNHDSPLRTERHVNQMIAAAATRIAAGSQEILELGNPDVRKEFSFAGDVVEAVWRLVNQDAIHEVVIGSGEAHSIREWADCCFSRVGLRMNDHVSIKAGYVPGYDLLVSDPTLIRSIGWSPRVGFQALADMMMGQP
jgi:GDPmannose 4,6-dehydratase